MSAVIGLALKVHAAHIGQRLDAWCEDRGSQGATNDANGDWTNKCGRAGECCRSCASANSLIDQRAVLSNAWLRCARNLQRRGHRRTCTDKQHCLDRLLSRLVDDLADATKGVGDRDDSAI